CILVAGPDVVFDPDDPNRTPLTNTLASKLAETLNADTLGINRYDLAQVGQLRYNADGDRYDLELAVRDFFEPYADRTTSFHRDLSTLPFTLCLTTSAVPFILNAFKAQGKAPLREFYHYREPRPMTLPEGTASSPIVYHLYGDLQQLDSLVLTETDLLEFL